MKNASIEKSKLRLVVPNITNQQIAQLERFAHALQEWNKRYNLVSRKDIDHVWENHILPSLVPLGSIEFPEASWLLDIGSGGGFPAIPIRIVRPDLQILMVDSVRKKTLFLQKVILDLQLKNIAVKRERIESLRGPTFAEKFDIVTARAVSNISQLIHWSRPFLKDDGFLLLWKGLSDTTELQEVAAEARLRFEIIPVQNLLKELSPKFEELCFFQIWID